MMNLSVVCIMDRAESCIESVICTMEQTKSCILDYDLLCLHYCWFFYTLVYIDLAFVSEEELSMLDLVRCMLSKLL